MNGQQQLKTVNNCQNSPKQSENGQKRFKKKRKGSHTVKNGQKQSIQSKMVYTVKNSKEKSY